MLMLKFCKKEVGIFRQCYPKSKRGAIYKYQMSKIKEGF